MLNIFNPYQTLYRDWYTGDLHIHSTQSDGTCTLEEIHNSARQMGLHFYAVTDHDVFTPELAGYPLRLAGNECSSIGGHIVVLGGASASQEPRPLQEDINRVVSCQSICLLAHPRIQEFRGCSERKWFLTNDDLLRLSGYIGIEIYTHNLGSGPKLAVDRLDALLSAKRISWGFAASDAHDLCKMSTNVGIVVNANACTCADIYDAIIRGRFYSLAASQARIRSITLTDCYQVLEVCGEFTHRIRIVGKGGMVLAEFAGDSGRYCVRGDEGYLRVEAEDCSGGIAYSNPLVIR